MDAWTGLAILSVIVAELANYGVQADVIGSAIGYSIPVAVCAYLLNKMRPSKGKQNAVIVGIVCLGLIASTFSSAARVETLKKDASSARDKYWTCLTTEANAATKMAATVADLTSYINGACTAEQIKFKEAFAMYINSWPTQTDAQLVNDGSQQIVTALKSQIVKEIINKEAELEVPATKVEPNAAAP